MKLSSIVFLTIVLFFTSCDQPTTIEWLWVVKSVIITTWYDKIKDKTELIRPFAIIENNRAKEFVVKDLNGFILNS